jgi:alkylation response protein AidB-like acyl-CoA dehydrogenase
MKHNENNSSEIADALAREFAQHAGAHDRAGSFPFENFDRLSGAGLTALTVPREYGGRGAGLFETCAVVGAIARGDASTALVLTMQYIAHALLAQNPHWPRHLVGRVSRDAVEQGAFINHLRVEPELGTPARGGLPASVATRQSGGWLISGHKLYSTGIPLLSWLAVWARTDEAAPRVGIWLVPAEAAGIQVIESWDHLGMRASASHEVVLSAVQVPADHAVDLRPPSQWAAPDAVESAWFTLPIAALYDGVARAARDWLVRYLIERTPSNLGAPLSTLPRFQEAVGEIDGLLLTNQVLIRTAAERTDWGSPPAVHESGLIKLGVTTNAIEVVQRALALVGNPGLSRHNPLERHYRDVLCSRVHTPQNDSIMLNAGRAAFEAISN